MVMRSFAYSPLLGVEPYSTPSQTGRHRDRDDEILVHDPSKPSTETEPEAIIHTQTTGD